MDLQEEVLQLLKDINSGLRVEVERLKLYCQENRQEIRLLQAQASSKKSFWDESATKVLIAAIAIIATLLGVKSL